ncbi:peptidoglycan D,D-transpeptidase FtsI family protein [Faecalimonas umbilicata]|uniref:peptidoglycan D,D-transpeptidase FtsI family protein n=1 Tax=Faecalimonas umbilicata TaxID=1912855 RepID=UPI000E3FF78F|nr:penicillin-binding protein 2 [Faecalimonas umbilicata]RGC78421.1 penicillin-binding protein 2 [Lachnospiraceae bacterium AM25-17]RJU66805.1 penicillin-binding protein 2 [Coprococcus sp. AM27-12LB]
MSKRKKRNSFHFLKRKFSKIMQKKLVLLFSLVVLAFAILIGRIIQINAMNGEKYTKVVLDQQQYDSRVIPFRRGDIVDRNGTKLATSERVYNVILDVKAMLEKDEYQEPTIKVLKDCFGIAEEDVEELVESSPESRYNILLKGVDYNTAKEFEAIDEDEEKHPNVKGIWLEEDYVRKYPYNSLASDVIGFSNADDVGTIGLEASYNAILNGVDGREYGYLEEGALLERTIKEAENGNTIVSTIDAELQKIVEKHILEFNEAYKDNAEKGNGSLNTAVIIADPQSGEILAQASYPNFDLNKPRDISAYYTEKELKKMKEEEKVEILNNLWRDFCVSDSYEPGSTAKPFTVAAGLETGKIRGNEVYTCGGSLVVAEDTEPINCHYTAGHGTQTIAQSIANSCNVAMMEMIKVIGAEDFYRYQSIFGFGAQTGIDLPGEAEGILQDPELVGPVDLATNSFGQNFNVTMEQMVAGMSALINGGNYYEPHVVKQIQDENGNVIETKESVLKKRVISEQTSAMLKQYMKTVMEGTGTGAPAAVEGYDIGGKTGTAEKYPRNSGKHLLSFIGYAPQDEPEVLIYVVIDEPNTESQEDSSLVLNLARSIMEEAFPYMNISTIDGQPVVTPEQPEEDQQAVEPQAENETETESQEEVSGELSYEGEAVGDVSYEGESYDDGAYGDGTYEDGSGDMESGY